MRWKVEGGSEGERGGKSGHGTSTHQQFFVAVETDDGGQFLSRADGYVAVHTPSDKLGSRQQRFQSRTRQPQPKCEYVSLQVIVSRKFEITNLNRALSLCPLTLL